MLSLSHIVIFFAVVQGIHSLKCYTGSYYPNATNLITTSDTTTMNYPCSNTSCVCTSYRFQCSNNDSACTAQQLQNATIIWGYTIIDNSTCQTMMTQRSTIYMNVTCCSTDLCNNQGFNSTTTPGNVSSARFLSMYIFIFALCVSFIRI